MSIAEDTFFAPEDDLVTVDISPDLLATEPVNLVGLPQLGEPIEFRATFAQEAGEDGLPRIEAIEADTFPEEILFNLDAAKGMNHRWIRASFIVEMNLTNGHAIYTWTNDDGDYRDLENPAFLMKRLFVKMADKEASDAAE